MISEPVVITDTNAIILLLRIAPQMFQDKHYGCLLPEYAYDEFIKKPEFKELFPWRADYKKFLHLGISIATIRENKQFQPALDCVAFMPGNEGLSKKDQQIVSVAIAFNYALCTDDRALESFARKQFCVRTYSPLELINRWLQDGLFEWDDEKQNLLTDWNRRPQPPKQIKLFKELTGCSYPP